MSLILSALNAEQSKDRLDLLKDVFRFHSFLKHKFVLSLLKKLMDYSESKDMICTVGKIVNLIMNL
jgi:hypothetical protein